MINLALMTKIIKDGLNAPLFWAVFIGILLILFMVSGFVLFIVKKKFVTSSILLFTILIYGSYFLNDNTLFYVLIGSYLTFVIITLFINASEVRPLLANPLKKEKSFFGFKIGGKSNERRNRVIYDRDKVFTEIATAVDNLSKTKTGALITLQRNMALENLIKNGQPINAPVSSMLLQTIFYKGTTLHDGGVVICDNMILAAAVYYTASTKALSGKVGSRHRAALGVSEVTDTVTIVVSEETGRISIAFNGQLIHVTKENFIRVLTEYMDAEDEE